MNFFERMCEVIPDKGGLRMVINRTGGEMIVTVEIKTAAGWTSPIVGRGHTSTLDDNFFNDVVKGVGTVKEYLVDTSKMKASVTPIAAAPTKVVGKPAAIPAAAKAPVVPAAAPKAEEASLFSAAPEVAEIVNNVPQEAEPIHVYPLTVEETYAVEVEEEDEVENEDEVEAIPSIPVDAEGEVINNEPIVALPTRDESMALAKSFFDAKDYKSAHEALCALILRFPGDAEIQNKIDKIAPRVPKVEDENDF